MELNKGTDGMTFPGLEGEDSRRGMDAATLLRALVELERVSPDGCVVLRTIRDSSGDIVDFEFLFANNFEANNLTRPGVVVGRRLSEAIPEAMTGRFAVFRRVVETGQPVKSEVYYARSDCWFRSTVMPFLDGIIVRFQDVTARMRTEQERIVLLEHEHASRLEAEEKARRQAGELQAAREKLVKSGRLMVAGQLATGVGHEINNPLAFVAANLHVALEHLAELTPALEHLAEKSPAEGASLATLAQETVQALEEARKGADRIRNIVKDLRTLARSDEERQGPVDVQSALEFSVSMAMPHLRHRAQVVRQFSLVQRVLANESRLGQIFLNLLINAAQAIPEGDAARHSVTLVTRMEDNQVVVEVKDTGKGMSAEIQRQIFEPFFTTKPPGEGTGLGLPICLSLLQGMGGDLKVFSKPGQGSTFQVVLPAIDELMAPVAPIAAAAEAPQRRRILIVDDEPSIGSVMRRILARAHEVVVLQSGREALDLLERREDFDWVFCDLLMADLTGMDLYEQLEERRPGYLPRLIFMTGGGFTDRAQAFLKKETVSSIDKPFDPMKIRELAARAPPPRPPRS